MNAESERTHKKKKIFCSSGIDKCGAVFCCIFDVCVCVCLCVGCGVSALNNPLPIFPHSLALEALSEHSKIRTNVLCAGAYHQIDRLYGAFAPSRWHFSVISFVMITTVFSHFILFGLLFAFGMSDIYYYYLFEVFPI